MFIRECELETNGFTVRRCCEDGWSCQVDQQQVEISDENIAKYRNYVVISIRAENNHLNLIMRPWESPVTKVDLHEKSYQEYTAHEGTTADFFDNQE